MKIIIPTLSGDSYETEAEVVGDLAVHRSKDGAEWRMTHVPTLMGFNEAVPNEVKTSKPKMLKWAKRVQQEMEKDWAAMRKIDPQDVRRRPERTLAVRDRIRTHCLAIKNT